MNIMSSKHLDECLSKICSVCEQLGDVMDDTCSSDSSIDSNNIINSQTTRGSQCELAKYDDEYASLCTPCKCSGSYDNLMPSPGPVGGCCESTSNECHKLKKKAQQKWTIKHTGGNIKDWWDRTSLVHDTIKSGDDHTFPKKGDLVQIDYVGKLLNGTSFGWSRRPMRFRVGDSSVIIGLNRGIKQMSLGEKAKLYIPAEMAYGWVGGSDNLIPPDSDIIMTVTLHQIQKRGFLRRPKTVL